MREVRLGIIGLGVGTWHLESFKATPGAEVIALCDIDAGRLTAGGCARHPAPVRVGPGDPGGP